MSCHRRSRGASERQPSSITSANVGEPLAHAQMPQSGGALADPIIQPSEGIVGIGYMRLRDDGYEMMLAPLPARVPDPRSRYLTPATNAGSTKLTSAACVTARTATLGPAAQSSMRRYHTATLRIRRPMFAALSANARRLTYVGARTIAMPRTKQNR